jgi:DHA2 family multidrug resistance protein
MVEDPPWLEREKKESRGVKVDWLGLALVGVGFGCLQVVLDKGQQDDWFSSPVIVIFSMLTVIALVGTVVWESVHPNPIVNVRLFLNRNFATSAGLMFTLGGVLYGSTVLIPQFVQTLLGYSAERAGMVLSPGALFTMAMMPLVGFLVSRVPAKYLITFGFAGLAASLWHMTSINLGIDPKTATLYRIFQASSLAFLFVPINTVAYIGVPREQNNQVSGLMNLARNIGGSVGISYFVTALSRRSQIYQNLLVDHLSPSNPVLQDRLAQLQQRFAAWGPADATRRAYGVLYMTVQQQAAMLSYVHIIEVLAIVSTVLVPLILLLLRSNRPGAAPAGAH